MGPGENRLFWRNGHIQSYRTGQKTALQRKLRLRSATQSRANSVTRPDAVSLATTQRLSSFSFRSNRRRYHPAWNSARGVPDAKAESAVRSSARRSQRSLRCAAVQVGPLRQWIGDTAVRRHRASYKQCGSTARRYRKPAGSAPAGTSDQASELDAASVCSRPRSAFGGSRCGSSLC